MKLVAIVMEKSDGVQDFLNSTLQDEDTVFICIQPGHKVLRDLNFLFEYFDSNPVGLLYYDYIEDDRYYLFESFSYHSISFDRNIIIHSKVLAGIDFSEIKTFYQLNKKIIEMGWVPLHVPNILTQK